MLWPIICLFVIRPVEGAPPLNAVILTLGLYTLLVAVAGMIWGNTPRSFPAAFSLSGFHVGSSTLLFSPNDLFIVGIVVAVAGLLALLFRTTTLGLRMRAAAFAPEVARLLGVREGRMLTLGWALAAVTGSLAGIQALFDWSELRVNDLDARGKNHGVLLGTIAGSPPAPITSRRAARGKG